MNVNAYREYLESPEWQSRRLLALQHAGHRCQVCNSPDGLEVHHRTYERIGNEELEDLTVLCHRCHEIFHEQELAVRDPSTLVSALNDAYDQLDVDFEKARGLSMGLIDLDSLLAGLVPSE